MRLFVCLDGGGSVLVSGSNDPGKPDLSCLHDGVERELLGHSAFTTASLRALTHYFLFPSGVAYAAPPAFDGLAVVYSHINLAYLALVHHCWAISLKGPF